MRPDPCRVRLLRRGAAIKMLNWFKKRHILAEHLRSDARRLQERYGEQAMDVCETAIASVTDGALRRNLRRVRRLLMKSKAGGLHRIAR